MTRDSGSGRNGEDSRSEAECEAPQSGPAKTGHRPTSVANLTPSEGVERIRAEAFEEAAKAARGWVIWLLKGHEGRERIAESVAKRILSKGQALALPSEPPSQGDVEGRARELVREALEFAGDIRWRELAEGSPFTIIDRQLLGEMQLKARSAAVVHAIAKEDGRS